MQLKLMFREFGSRLANVKTYLTTNLGENVYAREQMNCNLLLIITVKREK